MPESTTKSLYTLAIIATHHGSSEPHGIHNDLRGKLELTWRQSGHIDMR
jgi:hypothetical protein